ncbi:hypothetical protein IMSHALPRED_008127 [Imshaugia aleurites]|uniref:Uncharacterized protein n=1 Tax=Imshaugia aleurites TaxID=172621 RepID=A0A8H3ISN5_9LECA|nr:hypothetical protein IMSHALPRED_008127 [Imshaugia aleurites]
MSTETSVKEYMITSTSDSPNTSFEQKSQEFPEKKLKVSAAQSNQKSLGQLIPSIDVTYSLVYSDIANPSPKDAETTSQIHIVGEPSAEDDGCHICIVYLHFRSFSCELTCLYHPSTGTFSAFEVENGTMSREMEDEAIAVEDIIIVAMQRRKKVDHEYVGEEVRDDNGNPFLFAFMDFGYSGRYPFVGRVYGKMVMPGEEVGEVSLSKEERARLNIEADKFGKQL